MNEAGLLKLNRSWKVKSFTKGLELFQAIADVAEAEGMSIFFHANSGCFYSTSCPLTSVHISLPSFLFKHFSFFEGSRF